MITPMRQALGSQHLDQICGKHTSTRYGEGFHRSRKMLTHEGEWFELYTEEKQNFTVNFFLK